MRSTDQILVWDKTQREISIFKDKWGKCKKYIYGISYLNERMPQQPEEFNKAPKNFIA